MKAPRFLLLAVLLATALALAPGAARAQSPDDPLRHGHALLIGNAHYLDRRWPPLDDVPLELQELSKGLAKHFDTVEVATDLDSDKLKQTLANFLGKYGSDRNARLMIYYAGHGYTELIAERNENRGYITGIDTPWVDGATESLFDAARPKAVSMLAVRAPLEEVRAKSILFIFDSCFSGTIFADRGRPQRRRSPRSRSTSSSAPRLATSSPPGRPPKRFRRIAQSRISSSPRLTGGPTNTGGASFHRPRSARSCWTGPGATI